MSAMPPIATEMIRLGELTRCATTGYEQSQQTRSLFDHLVGASKQRRRHFEAARLRGIHVNHQLEFGRLNDRQVTARFALEDAAPILTHLTPIFSDSRPPADEP